MNLNKLSSKHIKQYQNLLAQRGVSESTIKRKLSSMRKFSGWLVKEGYLKKDPLAPRKKWFPQLFYRPRMAFQAQRALPYFTYLNFIILAVFLTALGWGLYQQFVVRAPSPLAYPEEGIGPKRYLSFQGRLTDSGYTPIVSAVNMEFSLYDSAGSGSPPTGGTLLWESGTCSVDPDQDGIFAILLGTTSGDGYTCSSATEIDSHVFSENAEVWLHIKVGSEELDPRIQIATVAYALNAETLQGFPLASAGSATPEATMGATARTVPAINPAGNLVIAASSPTLWSTSGTFGIKGQAISIQTDTGTDGNITLAPDGTGVLNIVPTSGNQIGGTVNATNSALTTGALYTGRVENDNTGFDFLRFFGGSTPSEKFSVGALGSVDMANNLDVGGAATITGTLRVDGSVISNLVPSGTRDLGSSGSNWDYLYVNSIDAFTLQGAVTGNNQTITGLEQLTVNNLRLDGNTLDSTTGDLTLLSVGELYFDDTRTGAIPFSVSDTALNAALAQGIIDAINDAYDAAIGVGGTSGFWTKTSGVLFPNNTYESIAVGGTSTTSAQLYFEGTTGNASMSGNLALAGGGTIAATDMNNLTLGDSSTQNVIINPNGRVGIGTTSPSYNLHLAGTPSDYLAYFYNSSTNAAAAGLHIRVDGDGNLLTLNAGGSDIVTISEAQATFNTPTSFTSAGDVSIAYDLIFTNQTASYIKSYAPLYIEAGESFENNDLTLRTYNKGNVIVDSEAFVTNYAATVSSQLVVGTNTAPANIGGFYLTNAGIYGKALAIFNQTEGADILTASASGSTRLTVSNAGNLAIEGALSDLSGSTLSINDNLSVVGNILPSTGDTYDIGATTAYWNNLYVNNIYGGSSGTQGFWSKASGLIYPNNAYESLAIGGTSTASAKLYFEGTTGDASMAGTLTIGQGETIRPAYGPLQLAYKSGADAWTTGMVINESGNVGIGTTEPTYKLDVQQNAASYAMRIKQYDNSGDGLLIENSTRNANWLLLREGTSTDFFKIYENSGMRLENVVNNSELRLISTGSTGHILLEPGGNVGIGTTAPSTKLHVDSGNLGDVELRITGGTNNSDDPILRLTSYNAPTTEGLLLRYDNDAGASYIDSIFDGVNTSPAIYIRTETSATPINTITITHGGNIGLGTTSPVAPLHVAGSYGSNAALIVDQLNSGDILTASASATTVARINNSGDILTAGTLQAGSATSEVAYNRLGTGTANFSDIGDASDLLVSDALEVQGIASISALLTPYHHVITVAKQGGDFTTITAALSSITDNSATNTYLIRVMPGTYDEAITMKEYVDIIGSGWEVTKITQADATVVTGADNARIEGFEINVSAGTGDRNVIYTNNTSPTINKNKITSVGTGHGVRVGGTGAPTIVNNEFNTASTCIFTQGSGTTTVAYNICSATNQGLRVGAGTTVNSYYNTFSAASDIQVDNTGTLSSYKDTYDSISNSGTFNKMDYYLDPLSSISQAVLPLGARAYAGGSVGGTYLGINSAASYYGDFLNFLNDGTSRFKVGGFGNLDISVSTASAALTLDQAGVGLILTASVSGTTVANLDTSGNLEIEGALSDLSDSTLSINDSLSVTGNILPSTGDTYDLGATTAYWDNLYVNNIYGGASGTQGFWSKASGLIYPNNAYESLAIGGISTASAQLYFEGTTGNASMSGELTLFNSGTNYINALNNQALSLRTSVAGDAGLTDRLYITNDGNVGIGTTGPGAKLHLAGTGLANGLVLGDAGDVNLYRYTVEYLKSDDGLVLGHHLVIPATKGIYLDGGSNTYITETSNDNIDIYIGGSQAVRIDSNGNVGIGTTAPVAPLHVAGSYGSNAALIVDQLNSGDILTASASATTVARINNSGDILTAGTLQAGSATSEVAYNRLGTGTANFSDIGDASDLLISDALEVQGIASISALLTPYHHVITVAKQGGDYLTITDALSSITDNSSSNTYLIRVMPGTYAEQVTMKDYVDIKGSGWEVTIIDPPTSGVALYCEDNSRISDIKIQNDASYLTAVVNCTNVASADSFYMDDVYINGTSGAGAIENGYATIYNSMLIADGSGWGMDGGNFKAYYTKIEGDAANSRGINGSVVTLWNCEVTENANVGNNSHIYNSRLTRLRPWGDVTVYVYHSYMSEDLYFNNPNAKVYSYFNHYEGNIWASQANRGYLYSYKDTFSPTTQINSYLNTFEQRSYVAESFYPLFTVTQKGTGDIVNIFDDSTEVFTILDGGKIGIGITAPNSLLHVNGTGDGNALVIFDETGGEDIFTASASGSTKMTLSSAGNLTIAGNILPSSGDSYDLGSTTAYWDNLYVNNIYGGGSGTQGFWTKASGVIYPNNAYESLAIGGTATSSAKLYFEGTTGNASMSGNLTLAGGGTIGATDMNNLTIGDSNTQNVIINPNGNVGIGTTAPSSALEVNGDVVVSEQMALNGASINDNYGINVNIPAADGGTALFINGGNAPTSTSGYGIYVFSEESNNDVDSHGLFNQVRAGNIGSGSNITVYGVYNQLEIQNSATNKAYGTYTVDGPNAFSTGTYYGHYIDLDDTGTNWAIYVEDGGGQSYFGSNVGIGTTAPTAELDVAGTASVSALTIRGTSPGYINQLDGNDLIFRTSVAGDAGLSEVMTITNAGNVGIGTTGPDSKLSILSSAVSSRAINIGGASKELGFDYAVGINTDGTVSSIQTFVNGQTRTAFGTDFNMYNGADLNVYSDLGTTKKASIDGATGDIYSAGDVGIGTTSPTAKLDVAGDASVSGSLVFRSTTPSIKTLGDKDLIFQFSQGGDAGLATKLTLDPDGDLTFSGSANTITNTNQLTLSTTGATSDLVLSAGRDITFDDDNLSSPVPLSVADSGLNASLAQGIIDAINDAYDAAIGTGGISGFWTKTLGVLYPNNAYESLAIGGTSTSSASLYFEGTTGNASMSGQLTLFNSGTNYINALSGQDLSLRTSVGGDTGLTDRIYITNAGYVGIGTTEPTVKLQVGDYTTTTNTKTTLMIAGRKISVDGEYAELIFRNSDDSGGKWSEISAARESGNSGTNLTFSTTNTSGTFDERVRISNAGNVGIGTTAPTALLDIAGDASTSGSLVFRGTSPATIDILNGDDLRFQTSVGGDDSLTPRMTITNAGDVGIGTTGPIHKLDVDGNVRVRGEGYIYLVDTNHGLNVQQITSHFDGASSYRGRWTEPSSQGWAFMGDGTDLKFEVDGTSGDTYIAGALHSAGSSDSYFSGNVGIGTTAPAEELDVAGNATISGTLSLGPQTEAYAGTCDPSAEGKMYYDAGQNKYYYCNGSSWTAVGTGTGVGGSGNTNYIPKWSSSSDLTDSVIYEASSKIGIGTTEPSAELDVDGDASVSGSLVFRSTTPSIKTLGDKDLIFQFSQGGDAGLATKLTLDPDGDLTFSGSANTITNANQLTLSTTGASSDLILSAGRDITFDDDNLASPVALSVADSALNAALTQGIIDAINEAYDAATGAGGSSAFWTKTSGLLFPNNTYESLAIGGTSTTSAQLYFEGTTGNASMSGNLTLAGGGTIGVTDMNNLTLGDSSTQNVIINPGGNVGIGTATPSYKLHLAGTPSDYLAYLYNSSTNAAAAGLYIRVDGDGNLLTLNAGGSDIVTISEAQATFNTPTSFTSAGDVSIAYDLIFTNQTASYIKSNAPLYLEAGESFESNDLTLRTYNKGNVIVDSEAFVTNYAATVSSQLVVGTTTAPANIGGFYLTNASTYGKALAIFNQTEGADIITASASGSTRLTVSNAGNLAIEGALSDLSDATLSINDNLSVVGNILPSTGDTYDLGSTTAYWNNLYANNIYGGSSGTQGFWSKTSGVVYPNNTYESIAIGGTSTTSAQLYFEGTTGNASMSGNLTLAGGGTIAATDMNNLTLGDSSTQNIIINPNGNVGIGTTEPAYKLHVDGTFRSTGTSIFDGQLHVGTLLTDNIQSRSNGYVRISTGGSERLRVAIDGNIGIGTTSPTASLHIDRNSGGNAGFIVDQDGTGDILSASASGSPKFTINNSGYVGIGTTDPQEELDIAGDATISGTLALAPQTEAYAGTCDTTAEGKMYYDAAGNAYYYCNGTSWTQMGAGSGTGLWTENLGLLYPINSTLDLAIGGTSTESAKFAFTNMATGTPTATFSGDLVLAGGARTISATDMNALTIGDASTGDIQFYSSSNKITSAGNLVIASDLTVSGGDITGTGDEKIDIGEETANTIQMFIDAVSELTLTADYLQPTTNAGLSLGQDSNEWNDLWIDGTAYIDALTMQGAIAMGGNNITDGGTIQANILEDNDDTILAINDNLSVTGNILPSSGDTYDLGATTAYWDNLYVNNVYGVSGGTQGFWTKTNGLIYPNNAYESIAIGGTSTTSAQLYFEGTTGNASMSGNLALAGGGTIGATDMNILTIGDASTGDVQFYSASNKIDSSGNLTIAGDATITGGDITGAGDEGIDIGEETANTIQMFIDAVSELNLTADYLQPTTNAGLSLGQDSNEWQDLWIDGTAYLDALTMQGAIAMGGNNITDGGTIQANTLEDNDDTILALNDNLSVTGNVLPSSGSTYDLGAADTSWANVYTDNLFGGTSGTIGFWTKNSGVLYPNNTYESLVIGGTSTTSASLYFDGTDGDASMSGVFTLFGASPAITTTNMRTLTLGDASTGNIIIYQDLQVNGNDILDSTSTTRLTLGTTTTVSGNLTVTQNLKVDTDTLFVDSSTHRVGIGTTDPQAKLDIAGASSLISNSSGDITLDASSGYISFSSDYISNLGGVYGDLNVTGNLLNSTAEQPLKISDWTLIQTSTPSAALMVDQTGGGDIFTASTSGVAKFVIKNNGDVGIGTTGPGKPLHIKSTATDTSQIRLDQGNTAQGYLGIFGSNVYLDANINYTGSWAQDDTSRRSLNLVLDTQDADSGGFVFEKSAAGSATLTPIMLISSGGNVGIGTTAPTAELDVAGTASVSALTIRGTSPGYINQLNGNDLIFRTSTGGDAGLSEVMTITNAGDVGIGTTAPATTLDVSGDVNITGTLYNDSSRNTCRATKSSKSIPSVSATIIDFNTEDYDNNTMHDTVTNNSRVTVKKTGIYLVVVTGQWGAIPDNRVVIFYIYKNGGEVAGDRRRSFAWMQVQTTWLGKLTANDYVEMAVYQDDPSAQTVSVLGLSVHMLSTDSAGADLAEYFPTHEDISSLPPGTLVSIDPSNSSFIKKSNKPFDNLLLGIVPTNPGLVIGEEVAGEKQQMVALAGRVPTLVSLEGGKISPGDYITSSSLPGYGMKINPYRGGPAVGIALEGFDPSSGTGQIVPCPTGFEHHTCGKIMVFVNVSWYDPDAYLTDTGDLNIQINPNENNPNESEYSLTDASGQTIERIGAFGQAVIAQLRTGLIEAQEIITGRLVSTEIETGKLISPVVETETLTSSQIIAENIETTRIDAEESEFGKLLIKSEQGETVASIDSQGNASFGGLLEATAVTSDQLSVTGDATVAGTLYADHTSTRLLEVDELRVAGEIIGRKATFGDLLAATISADIIDQAELDEIQARLSELEGRVSPSPTPEPTATPTLEPTPTPTESPEASGSGDLDSPDSTDSGELDGWEDWGLSDPSDDILLTSDITITGDLTSYGITSLADTTIAGQLMVDATIIIDQDGIQTLPGSTLKLQAYGWGGIDMLGGKVVIDTEGDVLIIGNLTVAGNIATSGLILSEAPLEALESQEASESGFGRLLAVINKEGVEVASIDASGSAFFAQLGIEADYTATQSGAIIAAAENYYENGYLAPAIKTNATAGIGILPAYEEEVMIYNPQITGESLIYVTATTNTENKVLYIKAKHAQNDAESDAEGRGNDGWFIVALNEAIDKDVQFNWWIIGGRSAE